MRWPDLEVLALLAGVALVAPVASVAVAETLRVGPGEVFETIAAAAQAAGDGDIVEVRAGLYRGDVAVWLQRSLTIRAIGGRAVLQAEGRSAEAKAIWVIRQGDFEISGFDFVGARVPDRNGAGIRFEGGRLVVRDARFIDNQMGILTGNDGVSELIVEGSEFSGPRDGERWYHNLYVGAIDRLTVTDSRFHHARRGHLLKSRARENEVRGNRLADEGGTASYELEFPNGGIARVVDNLIEQSPHTDNPVIVAFGAEGYRWPENRLAMQGNTVVNRASRGVFVRVWPGPVEVAFDDNRWVGPGGFRLPAGVSPR